MYEYTVCCHFNEPAVEKKIPEQWLEWLAEEHLADVLAGGALSARVVELADVDPPGRDFRIHYTFPDRAAFDRYEREFAPHLREEGLTRFPLAMGLTYARVHGEVLAESTAG